MCGKKILSGGNGTKTDLLHQSIGDGHTRELSPTSMGSLFTMSSQSRDLAEIKVESLYQPVDCISRLVC
jgi:hypothetical protein